MKTGIYSCSEAFFCDERICNLEAFQQFKWAKRETMRVVTLGIRNPMVIFYVRSIDVVPREMILILPDIISLYYRMLA
jgi:hypothetical protein